MKILAFDQFFGEKWLSKPQNWLESGQNSSESGVLNTDCIASPFTGSTFVILQTYFRQSFVLFKTEEI